MDHDRLSINVLELFSMVWTACVMIMMGKNLPTRDGEAVLVRGDNSLAVQWVLYWKRGKYDVPAEGLLRILGTLQVKGKWCF